MTEAELQYLIKVNDRDLRELKGRVRDTNKALGQTGDVAGKTGGKFKAFVNGGVRPAVGVLAALAVGARKAVGDASSLGEQTNKTTAVFKGSAPKILAWSKTTAESLGISQRAALQATGTFGNMLVPMGLARSKAGDMSQRMVGLAADMASFNDASPEDTLDALRSGLAGETEPLRKFGVFLSAARVEEEALRLGLVKQGEKLDAAAKAQATYSIILKDTKDAQGDFARTSDSAANAERIVAAQTENLSAKLGGALLPAYQRVLGVTLQVIGVASRHSTATKVLIGVVAGLATALLVARAAMALNNSALLKMIRAEKTAAAVKKAGAAAQWLLNIAMSANPVVLIVAGIIALGVALVVAYKKSQTFRRIVQGAMDAVGTYLAIARGAWDGLVGVIRTLVDWAGRALDKLERVADVAGAVGDAVGGVSGFVGDHNPFSARGGAIAKGQTTITGDRGPEAFVAPADGFILPAGPTRGLRGGGPLVNVETLVVRSDTDIDLVAAGLSRKLALR